MEDEMARQRTGHPPSYAEAKKMKSLTFHTHDCLSGYLKINQSINQSIFVYSEHQADRTQLVTLVSHVFIYVFICMLPCPFWISFNLILSDFFRKCLYIAL